MNRRELLQSGAALIAGISGRPEFRSVKGLFEGLLPEERLLVSEWADKHRYLASGASPEPGLYKTSRTPYLKKIMDCLSSHSPYRMIIYKKAAQIGATEAGLNWLGYCIDNSPGSILSVMPTEGQMKRNSKMRIDPMIKATPRLSQKISNSNRKDASNTILQKDFPGGTLIMTGANSASGLRSMPIQYLFMDEVDGYPLSLDGEGSPIDLALARVRNYPRHKIFMPSTPTIKGSSIIDAEYEKTDKQKFFMPCPSCGTVQHLVWENVKWVKQDHTTAIYECPHCSNSITDRHKRDMLTAGYWEATDPERSSLELIGFHNNSLVSPWYKFVDAARDYLRAGNDEIKLITFVNTVLGECSESSGDAPKWHEVSNKAVTRERNKPPKEVKFITMGVDVQKNRLALHVVGWGHEKRRWVLDYEEIPGDVETDEAWNALRLIILSRILVREDGLEMPIRLTAIDSGNWTARVYQFCKEFSRSQVVPIKGSDSLKSIFSAPMSVAKTEAGKNAGSVMLYNVGSTILKKELYGYLRLNRDKDDPLGPKGYVHMIKLEDDYFKGLVAEEERIVEVKGYPHAQWYKIFARNEPLDTMNYARAAAAIVGMDRFDDAWMDGVEATYEKKTPAPKKTVKDITLSPNTDSYWD